MVVATIRMVHSWVTVVVSILVFCVVFSGEAVAWGPGTHLKFAEAIFSIRSLLPTSISTLLSQYPTFFFYGNIIADLILGKHYGIEYRQHSHNWQVAWDLLDRAGNGSQQAIMWGYLSHLAADVVAHNVFVPTQILFSSDAFWRGHAFWEAHYDGYASARYPLSAHHIQKVGRAEDAFLMEGLQETLFSHATNRLAFGAFIKMQQSRSYRRLVQRSVQFNPLSLPTEQIELYDRKSLDAIVDVLRHTDQSIVQRFDPTGFAALAQAKQARKRLDTHLPTDKSPNLFTEPLQEIPGHDDILSHIALS